MLSYSCLRQIARPSAAAQCGGLAVRTAFATPASVFQARFLSRSACTGRHAFSATPRTALDGVRVTSLRGRCVLAATPLQMQTASVFTNAKKSYARGTEEEKKAREEAARKESHAFFNQTVEGDGRNAPRAHDIESRLPTKKQLNEELPSAAELEQALREGKMDLFVTKPSKEED